LKLALGREAEARGYTAQFTMAMELIGALVKAQQQGTLEMRLAQDAKPKLLIIDELGCLSLEPVAGHLFFQLISLRYEQGSVPISSNRAVDEWGGVRLSGGGSCHSRSAAAPQPRGVRWRSAATATG
jgi:DNA replication protein DnaC